MARAAASVVFAVLLVLDPAVSVVRKCFYCRSRGALGDCRDPFYLSANSTIIESKKSGVETPPCSSGWCRKVIEGRENRDIRKFVLQSKKSFWLFPQRRL